MNKIQIDLILGALNSGINALEEIDPELKDSKLIVELQNAIKAIKGIQSLGV